METKFIRLLEKYSPDEFTFLVDSLHEYVTRDEVADGCTAEDYQLLMHFMDSDREIYNDIITAYYDKGCRIIDDMLAREAKEQGWVIDDHEIINK